MNGNGAWLTFYALLALSYAALIAVAARRQGPGRGCVAAAGLCGILGTLVPIAENAGPQWDGPRPLSAVPLEIAEATIVASFSSFVAAQILLLIGLLRAWRAREALSTDA